MNLSNSTRNLILLRNVGAVLLGITILIVGIRGCSQATKTPQAEKPVVSTNQTTTVTEKSQPKWRLSLSKGTNGVSVTVGTKW